MTTLSLLCTLRVAGHRIPQRCSPYIRIWRRSVSGTTLPDVTTFEDLGVNRAVCAGLYEGYPNITHPTAAQSSFIPAVLSGKDILLRDNTGTGKTFGLILALLSKPRRYTRVKHGSKYEKSPLISSVIITPHRDLAFQCLHWIKTIYDSTLHAGDLSSIAQVVVRSASNPLETQISRLRSTPPHLVIGTPQALLDIVQEDRYAISLQTLSTVVVDEADYLIECMPHNPDKYERMKYQRRVRSHPSPTRQILDLIYSPNRVYTVDHKGKKKDGIERALSLPEQDYGFRRPQLIVTSATLRSQFRRSLMMENGWLTKTEGDLVKVTGEDVIKESKEVLAKNSLGGHSMVHCALVVNDAGEVKNLGGAIDADPTSSNAVAKVTGDNEDQNIDSTLIDLEAKEDLELVDPTTSSVQSDYPDMQISEEDEAEFSGQPSPFNLNALEAVGAAFALDVPQVALLVLPSTAPVRRAVYDLRHLGVNAHGLDILEDQKGGAYLLQKGGHVVSDNPTLLVSTLASTRGMDLPDLSHVFLLGVPEDRSADTYLHVAGRVGRFGRGGKVVSVLEEGRHPVKKANGKIGIKDETSWFRNMFKTIGVIHTKLEDFE